ncbi:MAG: ABC transporter substrate-binding protein [Dehalococcoidales bacterium]|nr:ABC transporter substrate-binding protein [Dehalococcoidales bacterium]
MKKNLLYIFLSCLMIVSLLVASCGGDDDAEKEKDTESTTVETTYADPETPKYGGTHVRIRTSDWNTWDYASKSDMFCPAWIGEEMLGGDWKIGPAGTGENDWTMGYGGFINTLTGKLAESWEMPDEETLVYHIRPGIHWWNKAPANGRELTADDMVWNIERHFNSELSYVHNAHATLGRAPTSVKALDKYTVEVKVPPEHQSTLANVIGDFLWTVCPDAIEANGGESLNDWSQFIGTGPYIVDDYAVSSYIDYKRNDDYWQMDPLNPENQLPYADGLHETIIGDSSTQQAAFRTGQIDMVATALMTLGDWESVEQLTGENPELIRKTHPSSSFFSLWPRLDNKDLPFDDIRIRYAMNLAINQQELVDDYYGGNAELLAWPYLNAPIFSEIYTPLEEQSQIVQDLYGYDVARAKELMNEAGYPNGFKFTVDCADADFLSIIKEYLAAINIDMEINAVEFTVYMSLWMGGTYEQAFFASDYLVNPRNMMCMAPGGIYNYSRINDERVAAAFKTISENSGKNEDLVIKTLKEIGPYELELAVPLLLPQANYNVLWWPWLQNFYGAVAGGGYSNNDEYLQYFWIDDDMKTKMGYGE